MATRKSFLLRMPPDLWEEINRWARDELRSVNGQIEYVLRQAVRQHGRTSRDEDTRSKDASDADDPPT